MADRDVVQMRVATELRKLISDFADAKELSLADTCVFIIGRFFKRPDLVKASKGTVGRPKKEAGNGK